SAPSFSPAAAGATPRSSPQRMSTTWRWCLPACGTSVTDARYRWGGVPTKFEHLDSRFLQPGAQRSISWGAMKVLIVGGGGREHALAWKCAGAARVTEVLVAPGNAGTAAEPRVRNIGVDAEDIAALVRLAHTERVALTIVGPEGPLVAGIVDAFTAAGLSCFGPRGAAARLEGSKAFAKEFRRRHGIPTAGSATFTRASFDETWVRRQRTPLVVKASGLAAGKGVVIAASSDATIAAAQAMFSGQFGAAGQEVVIEEFLPGEEVSYIVMADGRHVLPLATS